MRDAPVLSLEALRQLEAMAHRDGIDLMARAARAVLDWVEARLDSPALLLVAAGPGNNGGDALLAACLLFQAGYAVEILLPEPPRTAEALAAFKQAETLGIPMFSRLPEPTPAPDLIIDGLFGIGMDRAPEGLWATLLTRLDQLPSRRLALDVPSGLNGWTGVAPGVCLRADHTLTFLAHKPGLFTADGADYAGEVTLDPLGWPEDELPAPCGEVSLPSAESLRRRRNSHKGSHGTVLVEGGAPGMAGAAVLAGRAALLAGAGKVHLRMHGPFPPYDSLTPELMLHGAGEALPDAGVWVCGPGLGTSQHARHALEQALDSELPLVLDADALNLLASDALLAARLSRRSAATVITPHPGEAARLLGITTHEVQANRVLAVQTLARQLACQVVLKGAGTLIGEPDGYFRINTTGSPALAAAGQGDVLSGIIAAFIAQGMPLANSVALAVHCHGLAGEEYHREAGGPIGLTASETARRVGRIINRLIG